jgi:DNA replication protein DnaC
MSDPVHIAEAAPQSAEPVQPFDFDAIGSEYLRNAIAHDARRRYEATVAQQPGLAATDWSRPYLDPNREQIARVLGWKAGRRGLLVSGPTGRGKTRAVFELFRRLACDEGRDVRYWFAGDWFAQLAEQNKYGRDDARGWIDAVARRPIVILDDLGQEAVANAKSDWAQAWFFRFLDIRISSGLPLIVTTNLKSEEIATRADSTGIRADPLVRRLLDAAEVVRFG